VGAEWARSFRWPVGAALTAMLGELSGDVREALADERARLSEHGYPQNFPQPALWWKPGPRPEHVPDELLRAVLDA
jgi:hypothetical protein